MSVRRRVHHASCTGFDSAHHRRQAGSIVALPKPHTLTERRCAPHLHKKLDIHECASRAPVNTPGPPSPALAPSRNHPNQPPDDISVTHTAAHTKQRRRLATRCVRTPSPAKSLSTPSPGLATTTARARFDEATLAHDEGELILHTRDLHGC